METQTETKALIPTITEQFNKSVQSIFYMINGKPDSKTKVFNKDICVDLNSIDDLNERVTSKLRNHYSIDQSLDLININITFDDKRTLNFSGWDSYKKAKITNPSSVKNITIIWDCLLKLPNYEMPQRHKLIVKITDGMKPQEFMNLVFSGKIEEVEEININSPVVASVDFIDKQIGDELINVVEEWIKTVLIPATKINSFMEVLANHKRKCSYFLNWLTTIFAIGSVFFVLKTNILIYSGKSIGEVSVNAIVDWLSITFFGFVFCFFVYRVSYYISNNIFRILERQGEVHIFNITKGDANEIETIKKYENKSWKKILRNFLYTIFIDLICSGLSAVIVKLFS